MINYTPHNISTPERVLTDVPSGWRGLETILGDIVERFCEKTETAVEFGVEYGFSTVALSNYFKWVIGVDHFMGDEHAGFTPEGVDRYVETKERLSRYPNIQLAPESWEVFTVKHNSAKYDLIHVDAKHDFYNTYNLTHWACRHAKVVIAHDTQWFCDVAPALERVAKDLGKTAYNYPEFNGLGILV